MEGEEVREREILPLETMGLESVRSCGKNFETGVVSCGWNFDGVKLLFLADS